MPAFLGDLQNLVMAAGGCTLESKEHLIEARDGENASSTLIVYNADPPEGCQLGEEVSIYWQKINEAEDLAASSGARVVNHTWLLESVAACKLQKLVSLGGHFAA